METGLSTHLEPGLFVLPSEVQNDSWVWGYGQNWGNDVNAVSVSGDSLSTAMESPVS